MLCTCMYSGEPNPELDAQAKHLQDQMKSLEKQRQQLENTQTKVIKKLRAQQSVEKQFQEAVKVQGSPSGSVIKLVLRKRFVFMYLVVRA